MAETSRNCIKADRNFVKGYFCLAQALKNMNKLAESIKTIESGLAISSSNPDLKRMKKELTELQFGEQVATYCRTADEQMQNGDIAVAYKTLELANHIDAGNADIDRMMSRVKPKYDALEAWRKAGLSSTELYKEKGDEAYKAANFEGAIEFYAKCIDALKSEGKEFSQLALKAHSNRAACYKQISNFDGVIGGTYSTFTLLHYSIDIINDFCICLLKKIYYFHDTILICLSFFAFLRHVCVCTDCTAVLEIEPDNVKALIRRAQAFEGVERYRFALQDCKTVLQMPPGTVGKANIDLCNMMQHRLNRTVQQLKQMG